jgi:para-nitrobenzyl esterase
MLGGPAGEEFFLSTVEAGETRPLVRFPAGPARGVRTNDGLCVFRGLPYAEPPTGERRWKPPVPRADWQDVRDAAAPGFACIQPPRRAGSIYDGDMPPTGEDCLSLDIWAPEDASGLPVFVWIHGGSFIWGAGSEPVYDGAALAQRGMVVVSINYRLGIFGYLAHPELSAESPDGVSGNYGLLDQIEALRWVRRNIAAVGGDPDNVTIAGESAGAFSVMCLMAAPSARGLFARAIAQSAYMVSMPSLKEHRYGEEPAEEKGSQLGRALGALDIASLRSMEAQDIANHALQAGFLPIPIVDGHVLPEQLVEAFDHGAQAPVPLLTGFTSGEVRSLRFLMPALPASAGAYEAEIHARYGDLAGQCLALYPAVDMEEAALATLRDALYTWTSVKMAKAQQHLGAATYIYCFDHAYPAAQAADLHAFHGSEMPYIFGTMDRTPPRWPAIPATAGEAALSNAMGEYWSSFARTGVPQASGYAGWPAYLPDGKHVTFADQPRVASGALEAAFTFHDDVVRRRMAAGDIPWNWNVGIAAPPLPAKVR